MLNNYNQLVTSFPYTFKNWKYYRPHDYLPDPRMVIAKHMDWTAIWDNQPSPWNGLEPDDYTYGICHTRPVDLPFVKDQCFYYLQKFGLWFSMYYITQDDHVNLLNRELIKLQPVALWHNPKRSRVGLRVRKTLIQRDSMRVNAQTAIIAERLHQMGYYTKLKDKYFTGNEHYVDSRVGMARAITNELEFENEEDFINET